MPESLRTLPATPGFIGASQDLPEFPGDIASVWDDSRTRENPSVSCLFNNFSAVHHLSSNVTSPPRRRRCGFTRPPRRHSLPVYLPPEGRVCVSPAKREATFTFSIPTRSDDAIVAELSLTAIISAAGRRANVSASRRSYRRWQCAVPPETDSFCLFSLLSFFICCGGRLQGEVPPA